MTFKVSDYFVAHFLINLPSLAFLDFNEIHLKIKNKEQNTFSDLFQASKTFIKLNLKLFAKSCHYLSVCDPFFGLFVCIFVCVFECILFCLIFFYLSCLYALLFFNAIHYEFHYYIFKLLTI